MDFCADGDFCRQAKKILAILPRIIGYAAHYALVIKQIIIQRRNRADAYLLD